MLKSRVEHFLANILKRSETSTTFSLCLSNRTPLVNMGRLFLDQLLSALPKKSPTLTPLWEHVPNRTEAKQIPWYIKQSVRINAGLDTNVKGTRTSRVSWTKHGLLYHILLVKVS